MSLQNNLSLYERRMGVTMATDVNCKQRTDHPDYILDGKPYVCSDFDVNGAASICVRTPFSLVSCSEVMATVTQMQQEAANQLAAVRALIGFYLNARTTIAEVKQENTESSPSEDDTSV